MTKHEEIEHLKRVLDRVNRRNRTLLYALMLTSGLLVIQSIIHPLAPRMP